MDGDDVERWFGDYLEAYEAMRAAAYHHTETLGLDVTVVNDTSALVRGRFSWRRADGGEIQRLTATYLVTDGAAGRRISVLAVHG